MRHALSVAVMLLAACGPEAITIPMNGGFELAEAGGTTPPDGWVSDAWGPTFAADEGRTSARSVRAVGPPVACWLYSEPFALTSGVTYSSLVWYRGDTSSALDSATASVYFYDDGGSLMGSAPLVSTYYLGGEFNLTWILGSDTFVAQTETARVAIQAGPGAAPYRTWFDDISIVTAQR